MSDRYRIEWADNSAALEQRVNDRLAEGWQLAGGVSNGNGWAQAMVKSVQAPRPMPLAPRPNILPPDRPPPRVKKGFPQ